MVSASETAAMRRALVLAARGPAVGPNPRVGCVILDASGVPVAEGWHHGAGEPHAEVEALAADRSGAGRTAVVTLEPCHHVGRTGPCTRALLDAGITRVVIASRDPNPLAAGGAEALREAGADVETGVLATESDALNRRWMFALANGRPFVTWKFATTLDGRSAAADGTSRWITGPAARADVHARRATSDAVLVGTGTVLADDPRLTVRDTDGRETGRQPLRVVLGRRPLPPDARVLDDAAPTLCLSHRDPALALAELHAREIRHVWLEGGPTVAAAFLRAGLVDEVLAYVAPALLGAGPAAVADLGIPTLDRAERLVITDVRRLGDDILVVASPQGRPGPTGRTASEGT
ncbi:MAG: diaminohydroxyphosphoribosylaminopyrimidine deaminase [Actinomycetota bacterium]|nr:diaminohydroxyphosphoribosylaminopyrimidine deaminase [Actinomycetota bacterium]